MNLSDRGSEISFETDAFASMKDYREMQIVSTERSRSPQVDLSPDGITLRLRAHEGLLFVAEHRSNEQQGSAPHRRASSSQ